MKRVVLTGGSGFVGANLARALLAAGHEVHLVLRQGYAPWRLRGIERDVEMHVVALEDRAATEAALGAIRPEWAFHLAAYGAYSSQTKIQTMIDTNLVATVNFVDACVAAGAEAIVNTGSSSEYGFKDHAPSEEERVDPNSSYAITKVAATHYCRLAAVARRVRIPTLRLYSVYGPWEEPSRLIPSLVRCGLRGELPALVNPDVARDYIFVDDVCRAYLRVAEAPWGDVGAVFNVGTGVQTSLRDIVEVARRVMNIAREPAWGSMPNRAWDTSAWVANIDKLRGELGFTPSVTLDEGFRRTVDWLSADTALRAFYDAKPGRY
jgi:nucleoside-diphosphate-sugar epimerase